MLAGNNGGAAEVVPASDASAGNSHVATKALVMNAARLQRRRLDRSGRAVIEIGVNLVNRQIDIRVQAGLIIDLPIFPEVSTVAAEIAQIGDQPGVAAKLFELRVTPADLKHG